MTKKDGRPCRKCGTSEWYKSSACVACAKERRRQWNAANPDRRKETQHQWLAANPDKVHEAKRRHYVANSDKIKKRSRQWNAANPGKKSKNSRRYYTKNRDKMRERVRQWQQANPDKVNAYEHRRRTRKTEAGGNYTAAEWKALVKHQNGRCLACGKKAKLTADHVIPVVKGGSSNIDNIQGLCGPCNSSKRDKTIDYRKGNSFLRWVQRKLF